VCDGEPDAYSGSLTDLAFNREVGSKLRDGLSHEDEPEGVQLSIERVLIPQELFDFGGRHAHTVVVHAKIGDVPFHRVADLDEAGLPARVRMPTRSSCPLNPKTTLKHSVRVAGTSRRPRCPATTQGHPAAIAPDSVYCCASYAPISTCSPDRRGRPRWSVVRFSGGPVTASSPASIAGPTPGWRRCTSDSEDPLLSTAPGFWSGRRNWQAGPAWDRCLRNQCRRS